MGKSAKRRVGRVGAIATIWRVWRGSRRPGAASLGVLLGAFPRMAVMTLMGRYRGISRWRLALMVVAAAYVISPLDLIPEMLFGVFGIADDVVILTWLVGSVLAATEDFVSWEQARHNVIRGEVVART